jgi:hypothetical protein
MSSAYEALTPEQKNYWRRTVVGFGDFDGPGPSGATPAQREWFDERVAQLVSTHWDSLLNGVDTPFIAEVDKCASPSSWPTETPIPTQVVFPVPNWSVEEPDSCIDIEERPLLSAPVPRGYWDAARRALASMNFEQSGLKFISGKVLKLKWVEPGSGPGGVKKSSARFLRFDYEAWASNLLMDRYNIDPEGLKKASYFRECVWVESETLLEHDGDGVLDYVEYEAQAEDYLSVSDPKFPASVRKRLCALLSDYEYEIRAQFKDDEWGMPDGLHPDIERTLRRILAKS